MVWYLLGRWTETVARPQLERRRQRRQVTLLPMWTHVFVIGWGRLPKNRSGKRQKLSPKSSEHTPMTLSEISVPSLLRNRNSWYSIHVLHLFFFLYTTKNYYCLTYFLVAPSSALTLLFYFKTQIIFLAGLYINSLFSICIFFYQKRNRNTYSITTYCIIRVNISYLRRNKYWSWEGNSIVVFFYSIDKYPQ